jgi:hypothetical protein
MFLRLSQVMKCTNTVSDSDNELRIFISLFTLSLTLPLGPAFLYAILLTPAGSLRVPPRSCPFSYLYHTFHAWPAFPPEDGSRMLHHSAGAYLPDYTASIPEDSNLQLKLRFNMCTVGMLTANRGGMPEDKSLIP